MKINKFKKISNNKYKVYFEDIEMILYEDTILKYNLLYKHEIDDNLLENIKKDNYKSSIYDCALKYIDIRMRSIKEIRDYLLKKNYDINDIDNVIDKLIKLNLLNDKKFLVSYINDKLNITNFGPLKIKNNLLKLGIDESYIDVELNNLDENIIFDRLDKIIKKEIKILSKFPVNKIKNKIINKCINMGYTYESILDVINNYYIESSSDIKKDYDKLYSKYNVKYQGNKLIEVIKSKLYQKGYSIDDINKII